MRIAIYARVSTADQNCERQLRELREYAALRQWTVAAEYVDTGVSGSKSSRPQLDKLMMAARRREFDTVIVWALDRWGRSVSHLLRSIEELTGFGVGWMSLTQGGLDTTQGSATGQLLLTILGAVAQFERDMIRERVNSGVRNYRKLYKEGRVGKDRCSRSGKNLPIGRPKAIFDRTKALEMSQAGRSLREIAAALGVGRSTAHRLVSQKA